MVDATLAAALKQAKSKKMFFAFVGKGTDGKLIVSKTKISPKEIAQAKKDTGASMAVTGKCCGDGSSGLVFLVAKPATATLGAAIKKAAHRDAGVTIAPDVQLASDADDDDHEASAGATAKSGSSLDAADAAAPSGQDLSDQDSPTSLAAGQWIKVEFINGYGESRFWTITDLKIDRNKPKVVWNDYLDDTKSTGPLLLYADAAGFGEVTYQRSDGQLTHTTPSNVSNKITMN
jgi:hypothetical protein